ncbi:unnamed protein product [Linum trigynum]|uniref:Uncharacterized protein n=1 Tax=Linum trigynum TaxID=586398 RepID=A0AAV2FXQ7_9ROSI
MILIYLNKQQRPNLEERNNGGEESKPRIFVQHQSSFSSKLQSNAPRLIFTTRNLPASPTTEQRNNYTYLPYTNLQYKQRPSDVYNICSIMDRDGDYIVKLSDIPQGQGMELS